MSNRALRILIADDQHFRRMQIERALNQLNYYRVAPLHRLEELLTLVEYSCESFDLLIINANLAVRSDFDLLAFCLDHPHIEQALIYGTQHLAATSGSRRCKVHVSPAEWPDSAAIKRLMLWVDPPLPDAVGPSRQRLAQLHGHWGSPN